VRGCLPPPVAASASEWTVSVPSRIHKKAQRHKGGTNPETGGVIERDRGKMGLSFRPCPSVASHPHFRGTGAPKTLPSRRRPPSAREGWGGDERRGPRLAGARRHGREPADASREGSAEQQTGGPDSCALPGPVDDRTPRARPGHRAIIARALAERNADPPVQRPGATSRMVVGTSSPFSQSGLVVVAPVGHRTRRRRSRF